MEELDILKNRLKKTEDSIETTKRQIADLKDELRDLTKKRSQLIKEYMGKNVLVKEGQLTTLYLGIKEVEIICGRDSRYDEPVLALECTKVRISPKGITIEDTSIRTEGYSMCYRPSYLEKMSKEITLTEACNIVQSSANKFMNDITTKIKCIY